MTMAQGAHSGSPRPLDQDRLPIIRVTRDGIVIDPYAMEVLAIALYEHDYHGSVGRVPWLLLREDGRVSYRKSAFDLAKSAQASWRKIEEELQPPRGG